MDLKKLLNKIYEYLEKEYTSIKNSNSSSLDIEEYNILSAYFDKLKIVKNEEEINLLVNELKENYYNRKKSKMPCERINKLLSIMNSNLVPSESKSINKDEPSPGFKESFLENRNTLIYIKITGLVKEKYKIYYSDKNSEQKKNDLSDMLNIRRNFINDTFKNDPEILKQVAEELQRIEGLEIKCYEKSSIKEDEILSKEEFLKSIRKNLLEFNKAFFNGDIGKAESSKYEFDCLYSSLFNGLSEIQKYNDLVKNIFNLLITYNLNGDYNSFKSYYSNKNITSVNITNEMFNKKIEEAFAKIEELITEANLVLEKRENEVKIVYNNKSIVNDEKDIYLLDYKICDNILQMNMSFNHGI